MLLGFSRFCGMMSFEQVIRCGLEDISIQRQQAKRALSRDASWRVANGVADLPSQIDSLIDATMATTRLTLWLTDNIMRDVEKLYSHDVKMGRAPILAPGAGTVIDYYGIVESCEKQRDDEIMEVLEASAPVLLEMEKEWQRARGRYDDDGYFVSEETDAYIEWQRFLFEQCNPSEADAQDVERNGFAGSRLEFRDNWHSDMEWCCGEESLDWRLSKVCDLVEMSEDMDKFDLEVDILHFLLGDQVFGGPTDDFQDVGEDEGYSKGQPIIKGVPIKITTVGAKHSTAEWKYGKVYVSNFATPCPLGPWLGMEFVTDLRYNPGNVSNWAIAV